jgi:hypothetical protein
LYFYLTAAKSGAQRHPTCGMRIDMKTAPNHHHGTVVRIPIVLVPVVVFSLTESLFPVHRSAVSRISDVSLIQSEDFPTIPIAPKQGGIQPDIADAEFVTLSAHVAAASARACFAVFVEQGERPGYSKDIEHPPKKQA